MRREVYIENEKRRRQREREMVFEQMPFLPNVTAPFKIAVVD